jgi:hypothetical protein
MKLHKKNYINKREKQKNIQCFIYSTKDQMFFKNQQKRVIKKKINEKNNKT